MKIKNKTLIIVLIFVMIVLVIGIIAGLTKEKNYIIQSFKNAFNIDIDPIMENQWNIQYLSYEQGISTNIQPLNETILEINVTNINGGGYKFQSAICNISNADTIEKVEYNPATDVWTSTGNLQYQDLQYTYPEGWCSETNGYGFVLFSSTSQDKQFRLRFPEGEKRIILITGSNSEKVDISYSSIVKINNVAFVKFKANNIGRRNEDTIIMITNANNLR